jgi:hypothetical protein
MRGLRRMENGEVERWRGGGFVLDLDLVRKSRSVRDEGVVDVVVIGTGGV